MRARFLASYHDVNVSAPVLGDGNRHLHFTKHFPDRGGQYCAELTRAEWDELRRVRWSSPIMEAPGCLVPDVDFVAEDGKVFTDVRACQMHEASIAEAEFLKTQCGQKVKSSGSYPEEAGSIPATATIPETIEAKIINAIANKPLLVKDLAALLNVADDAIKKAIRESAFLGWSGPRVSLSKQK